MPDDSLRHCQGRVGTDNHCISRIEDVGGKSLISEEGVTDQGITLRTGMSLDPQVADTGQIGLATLWSLAPVRTQCREISGLTFTKLYYHSFLYYHSLY